MAKNEPSAFAKLIKSILAIVLIVVASVGTTLFLYDKIGGNTVDAEATPEKPAPLPTPIFTPLEPFTVTLRGDTGNRILYVAITIRVADEDSRRMIVNYMPEVRDRILRKLSEQKPDYVQTAEGRTALVQALTKDLEAPYLPQPRGPLINGVLFTAFVIQ
ncbi:flagellar basal body-associated FliL family protein [Pollutimonas sp. M17]|uniref:flagellar basal body-associated FliL family protein n=1 Tax=Pollutimonas sp. M17 TaxID=2962065 RepID=UPI0021F42806|nr:flagellar basal body-associated FliL family protein [Pollutimonas sp. M17]UYO94973.1 flagellar basal body-associated FliL family protein [Pollutimonas sp. M17]